MPNHSVHEHNDAQKRKGAGLFVIGVALFTIGLSVHNVALWIIGLIMLAFTFLIARKARQQK